VVFKIGKAQLAFLTLTILFGLRVVYIQQGWIADDAVLYYEMARLIASGDFQSAIKMFEWPFYPALIAITHVLTGLGIQNSGHLLSISFFTLTAYGLIQLVKCLGGSTRAQVFAVLLLMGSRYIAGDIMPMSTRDQGYWALMCLAIWQFVVFHQEGRIKAAILWQLFAVLGTLFRIEGAVIMMALPWAVWILPQQNFKQKQIAFIRSVSLLVIMSLFGVLLVFTFQMLGIFEISLSQIGRLRELFSGFDDIALNINQNLIHRVYVMRNQVIGEPFKEYAWVTFLLSLLSISIMKCMFVAGWAPALLASMYARVIHAMSEAKAFRILMSVLLIVWVTACLIILKVNILSGRYVVLFGLVLIVFSSLIMDERLSQWRLLNKNHQAISIFCALIIVVGLIGNIWPKAIGHAHERDAVMYVKQRQSVGQKALYTTARQRFYADAPYEGRGFDDWHYLKTRIEDHRVSDYEFVIINLDLNQDAHQKEAYLHLHLKQHKLDKIFYGYKKKKRVLVYARID